MSTWKTERSRWSRPLRSAIARASWSSLIAPEASRTSSGVLAVSRAVATAASARPRAAAPPGGLAALAVGHAELHDDAASEAPPAAAVAPGREAAGDCRVTGRR